MRHTPTCGIADGSYRIAACCLAGVLVALAAPAGTLGNGGYIPAIGYPDLPKIPAQRAIISWRNGQETLVVESGMDTPSPAVGWILPLPAEPTSLAPADPGVLTSMALCQRPNITHDLHELLLFVLILAALPVPFLLVTILVSAPGLRHAYTTLMTLCLLGLILAGILLPTIGTLGVKGTPQTGVAVTSTARVGHYDATILRAQDSAGLDAWLSANGLQRLPAAARAAVDDYIARKWCFVVARLAKEAPQATPHPLAATFFAEAPVFPMKLTGLAGSPTRVELYVIADAQYEAPDFTGTAAARYRQTRDAPPPPYDDQPARHYLAENNGLVVGHPDIGQWMWPGCTVTALSADLAPADMDHDVVLAARAFHPHRDHRFTAAARRDIAMMLSAVAALGLLIAAAIVFKGRRKPTRQHAYGFGLAGFTLALAIGLIWALLPSMRGEAVHEYNGFTSYRHISQWSVALVLMAKEGALEDLRTPETLQAALPRIMPYYFSPKGGQNPFTGQNVRVERSPGNISLRTEGDKRYLCIYDEDAREYRRPLPPLAPGMP